MRLPNGQTLMYDLQHAYDPVKAHDYYIKNRQLKGRKKGATVLPTGRRGPTTGLGSAALQKQRQAAAQRVTTLQKKLNELNKALKEKMAEAKKAEANAHKKPTAADKAKAARDAKQYRDTHKQKLKTAANRAASKSGGSTSSTNQPKKSAADQVTDIKAAIGTVQKALTAAKAQQRALG